MELQCDKAVDDSDERCNGLRSSRFFSILLTSINQFGPTFAIDGEVSNKNHLFFHSELEMHPWLEVKFPFPVLISYVTIINRKDSCWDRLRNVEVRVGMTSVHEGFTARGRGHSTIATKNSRWALLDALKVDQQEDLLARDIYYRFW